MPRRSRGVAAARRHLHRHPEALENVVTGAHHVLRGIAVLLSPSDLLRLRRASRSLRDAVDAAVFSSLSFAVRHLHTTILSAAASKRWGLATFGDPRLSAGSYAPEGGITFLHKALRRNSPWLAFTCFMHHGDVDTTGYFYGNALFQRAGFPDDRDRWYPRADLPSASFLVELLAAIPWNKLPSTYWAGLAILFQLDPTIMSFKPMLRLLAQAAPQDLDLAYVDPAPLCLNFSGFVGLAASVSLFLEVEALLAQRGRSLDPFFVASVLNNDTEVLRTCLPRITKGDVKLSNRLLVLKVTITLVNWTECHPRDHDWNNFGTAAFVLRQAACQGQLTNVSLMMPFITSLSANDVQKCIFTAAEAVVAKEEGPADRDIMELLLLNAPYPQAVRRRALVGTARSGRTDMIPFLLEDAVDEHILRNEALLVAASVGQGANIVARAHPAGATPLHCAAEHGVAPAVAALLSAGALSGLKDVVGRTPLHLAVNNKRSAPAIVSLLLDRGDGTAAASHDSEGWTPLHVAAVRDWEDYERDGREVVQRLLMSAHTDVDARTAGGQTALHLVSWPDLVEMSLPEAPTLMQEITGEIRLSRLLLGGRTAIWSRSF
ncbi:hypothetical protein DFJ73DRAFT_893465 [Zopfochytrium polystomum]|nr:hypothetical protein DFJ73DRAFT_893465 [Zopfochytrium polystomum]